MTRTVTAPNQKSAMPTFPTLSQMVRDGQADTIQHRRRTREALDYWFRQSERLNIAHTHYRLRGTRFTDFSRRIGGSVVANSDATPECHEYVLHMVKWSSKRRRPHGNTRPLKSSVLRHHAAAHPRHGCVFPLSLAEELLSVCPAKPVIIDPYIGSGTVAVAARSVS